MRRRGATATAASEGDRLAICGSYRCEGAYRTLPERVTAPTSHIRGIGSGGTGPEPGPIYRNSIKPSDAARATAWTRVLTPSLR